MNDRELSAKELAEENAELRQRAQDEKIAADMWRQFQHQMGTPSEIITLSGWCTMASEDERQ